MEDAFELPWFATKAGIRMLLQAHRKKMESKQADNEAAALISCLVRGLVNRVAISDAIRSSMTQHAPEQAEPESDSDGWFEII